MEKFPEFIVEAKEEPYKLVMFHNSHENIRDVGKDEAPDQILITKAAKKNNINVFHAEYSGCYISEEKGKLFLHSFPFDDKTGLSIKPTEDGEIDMQKPFELNPDNTLIFPRGLGTMGFTANRRWVDMINLLEDRGFKTIPTLKTWNMCSSKYYCNEMFRMNKLNTPKTRPITYSDDAPRVADGFKFPVILKASSGSQTGVGIVIIESMRSLHPTVQMLSLLSKNIDLIVQEYIKIVFDVRVIVHAGKILAAMRRDVISGDARSNASLGAETSSIELTELEIKDSLKAAELVNGELVGVDFLPSKDREKDQPYILEVNSMPGFGGIEKTTKDKSVTSEFLKYYLDRDNWTLDN